MSKKLISTIVTGVIVLVVIGVIIALVFGTGNNSASDTDAYKSGDVVEIPVTFTKNPGVLVAKTVVNYDNSVFEYVECQDGFFAGNTVNAVQGKVTCLSMASGISDVTETGTAFTLVFKVKEDAKAGEYSFSIDNEACEYANVSEQFVTVEASVTESIKIK